MFQKPFIGTAADSVKMSGGILDFDMNLLIDIGIQMFNIALLTVLLIVILYKPVKKYMAARRERIRGEIESAQKIREEAMELKDQYEQLLASIEGEREEILNQAHKKAMEKGDQLLFDARHESEAMYDRAIAEIELERKNMLQEMKEQMIEISTMMASRFVKVSMDRETQDKYIDEAFADWNESA